MGKYQLSNDKLIEQIIKKLKNNKNRQNAVIHIFNPYGGGDWYLSEVTDDGVAFGLCDIGYPELGYVDLEELRNIRIGVAGVKLSLEMDKYFEPKELTLIKEERKNEQI
jgi:hypothetical protein